MIDRELVTNAIFVSAMGDTRVLAQGREMSGLSGALLLARESSPNVGISIFYAEIIASEDTQSMFSCDYMDVQCSVDRLFEEQSETLHYDYLGWGGKAYNLNPSLTSADGYHPNSAGYAALAGNMLGRHTTLYVKSWSALVIGLSWPL